jgi:hypothetical protein
VKAGGLIDVAQVLSQEFQVMPVNHCEHIVLHPVRGLLDAHHSP